MKQVPLNDFDPEMLYEVLYEVEDYPDQESTVDPDQESIPSEATTEPEPFLPERVKGRSVFRKRSTDGK